MFTTYIGCILLMNELLVCISLLANSYVAWRDARWTSEIVEEKRRIKEIFRYKIIIIIIIINNAFNFHAFSFMNVDISFTFSINASSQQFQ